MDDKQLLKLTNALVKNVKKTEAFLKDPNKVAKEFGIQFEKEEEAIIKESGKVTLDDIKKASTGALAFHFAFPRRKPKEKGKPKEKAVST